MPLTHVFVSHATQDAAIANQLAMELKNAGHSTKVDTFELALGSNVIQFMNDGIANAHSIIILFSKHSKETAWQKLEIDGALWNETAQAGGRCIVIRLDDTPVPPLLGPKVYGQLKGEDPIALRRLVEEICRAILVQPAISATMSAALRDDSKNPFRHLRAEFFENRPDLHSKTFASPEAFKVGALEEMKPCFLEGSRGTGKSMLLLSLRARNRYERLKGKSGAPTVFGSYLKLSRGAICNIGLPLNADWDLDEALAPSTAMVTDVAAQELVIQIIESILSELTFCVAKGYLLCDANNQRALAVDLDRLLFDASVEMPTTQSLDGVLARLGELHKSIANYIRRRFIYSEVLSVPVATFDLEQLKRVVEVIRKHVAALSNSMFAILLDEYENLFPYQQRIVNGFIKLGPPYFTVKVAKKLSNPDTSGTTTGQELQETHDYNRIPLVYDVEDSAQRNAYYTLLSHIISNLCQTEGVPFASAETLLPEYDASVPEVDESDLVEAIAELCKVPVADFKKWPAAKRRERSTYYREAAIYRVLMRSKGRRPDKRFAGFSTLAFVSSGVIRYFQEILSVAYHLNSSDRNPDGTLLIRPVVQTRAVHFVSEHNLTTLSRNVERHGEELRYFLLDLGDCLHHKLLRHSSEPEAGRLTIADPEVLDEQDMRNLRRILTIGAREGVFQSKEGLAAFKPKHGSDPQPLEFNICRIFAPVLEISPRLRWRTEVECALLRDLLVPGNRAKALRRLTGIVSGAKNAARQPKLGLTRSRTP